MDVEEFVDLIDDIVSRNGLNVFTCTYYGTTKMFMSIPSTRCHIKPINRNNIYSGLHYALPLIENADFGDLRWNTHIFNDGYDYNLCSVAGGIGGIREVITKDAIKMHHRNESVPRDCLIAMWFVFMTSSVIIPNYRSIERFFDKTIKLVDIDMVFSEWEVHGGYTITTLKPFGTKLVIDGGGSIHEIFAPLLVFYGFEDELNKTFNEVIMVKRIVNAATHLDKVDIRIDGELVTVPRRLVDKWLRMRRKSDISLYELQVVE